MQVMITVSVYAHQRMKIRVEMNRHVNKLVTNRIYELIHQIQMNANILRHWLYCGRANMTHSKTVVTACVF